LFFAFPAPILGVLVLAVEDRLPAFASGVRIAVLRRRHPAQADRARYGLGAEKALPDGGLLFLAVRGFGLDQLRLLHRGEVRGLQQGAGIGRLHRHGTTDGTGRGREQESEDDTLPSGLHCFPPVSPCGVAAWLDARSRRAGISTQLTLPAGEVARKGPARRGDVARGKWLQALRWAENG